MDITEELPTPVPKLSKGKRVDTGLGVQMTVPFGSGTTVGHGSHVIPMALGTTQGVLLYDHRSHWHSHQPRHQEHGFRH
jgi:hypothetical protein